MTRPTGGDMQSGAVGGGPSDVAGCDERFAVQRPFVSVVIPLLNEEQHIRECVESVLRQDYPSDLVEVIVVDGGSTDRSCSIVRELKAVNPRVRLIGGPGINCPAAMNRGIRRARGEIICKVDAHGRVAPDFIDRGVTHLLAASGIGCVGGPIRPLPRTTVGMANVLARGSRFGVGGGVNVIVEETRTVQSVQCGIYRKRVFEEVGPFDEALQFGEDEEMNWRVSKGGYSVVSTPDVRFFYYPRESLRELSRQYFHYGSARVKVVRKHPDFLRLKHAAPASLVAFVGATLIASALWRRAALVCFAVLLLYGAACLLAGVGACIRGRFRHLWLVALSFVCLHFGYGLGFLSELGQAAVRRARSGVTDQADERHGDAP